MFAFTKIPYKACEAHNENMNNLENKKLLFFINSIEFFYSHRLFLAQTFKNSGVQVHICIPATDKKILTGSKDFIFHELPMQRGLKGGLLRELKVLVAFEAIYKKVAPDIVYNITIKPILYGTLISQIKGCKVIINAVTGIGYVFSNPSWKARILKKIIGFIYKNIFRKTNIRFIFQNKDDIEYFVSNKYVGVGNVSLVRSSGVNLNTFQYTPMPNNYIPMVLFPARLLWDKGLGEFVCAADMLIKEGICARFVVAGGLDDQNPCGVKAEQMQKWVDNGIIEWWGFMEDMVHVLQQSSIVCLPSYREGVPKALIEAMAIGRPIVTTDAPGCRETVEHGVNGYLVAVKDSTELAKYLKALILDRELANKFGQMSRQYAEENFAQEIVCNSIVNVCREACNNYYMDK